MKVTADHVRAILFGVATGDALGVPMEFKTREELERRPIDGMVGYGTHDLPPGSWSDDSSMTFCLAESLLDRTFSLHKLGRRFIAWVDWGYWTPHGVMFDIGNTTAKAIDRLRTIDRPALAGGNSEYDNGNGALMRILPLVLETVAMTTPEAFALIADVTSMTHRHIRSIIASQYYLMMAQLLMQGYSKLDAYNRTNEVISEDLARKSVSRDEVAHFQRILEGKLSHLSVDDIRGSGYVIHSLESAIWCLLHTDSYRTAVLQAVHLGEDTDTTAAITGGLAALCYGFGSIPEDWIDVLAKKEEIFDLANRLAEVFGKRLTAEDIPEQGDMVGARKLAHQHAGYIESVSNTGDLAGFVCSQIEAGKGMGLSVHDLLHSLFFQFRASKHSGVPVDEWLVNQHLSLLKAQLEGTS